MAPAVHQDGIDAGLKCPAQLMLGRVFVDCPVRQNHIDARVPIVGSSRVRFPGRTLSPPMDRTRKPTGWPPCDGAVPSEAGRTHPCQKRTSASAAHKRATRELAQALGNEAAISHSTDSVHSFWHFSNVWPIWRLGQVFEVDRTRSAHYE